MVAEPPAESLEPRTESSRDERIVYYRGERIYFRPLELADEPMLRAWINEPENWRTLCKRPPLNSSRETEWIESQGKDPANYAFGVVVADEDRLIGTTGLHGIHPVNRTAAFGIAIGDMEYQNRGYGTEAAALTVRFGFEELNLNKICLSVFSHNPRAIHVYEKVGFVREGVLRQQLYSDGQYRDEYRFAILREDWEAAK